MANDIESQNSINSLKASFCRQHFPELLQFLRSFDISEVGGKVNNTLNMRFLLQAYDHKENKKDVKNLKESCKWVLNDVREDEVLLAIDEYIAITSQTHVLMKKLSKLFKVNLNVNTDYLISNASKTGPILNYSFDDETTKSILEHFNIPVNDKKMGKQCETFKYFISDSTGSSLKDTSDEGKKKYYNMVGGKREELQFVNAFSLLASLRNWSSHEDMGFLNNPDQTSDFYKFIIYTHIGIVYICRRIWKNYAEELVRANSKYNKPKDFDSFTLRDEIIKINIAANDKTWTIEDCNYIVDQNTHIVESNKNEVSFEISAKKYQQISIHFKCNETPYDIPIVFNYYLWSPEVEILVKPPHDFSYKFEGIAGGNEEVERKIGEQFTQFAKLLEEAKGKFEEGNSKILKILGRLEPSLLSLRNLVNSNNEELRNSINKDILDIIGSTEKTILDKIDELNKNINQKQKQIDGNIGKIYKQVESINKKISKDEEIDYRKNRKELLCYYPLLFGGIAILLYVVLFQILDMSNIDYSVFYINNKWSILAIVVFVLFLLGLFLHKKYNTTKYVALSNLRVKAFGFMPFIATIVIILLAWGLYIPNKDINSLIANYDFAAKNHQEGDNAIAAKLMEDYLKEESPEDDEQVRIKLTHYYLNFANLKEKALDITRPMRDDIVKYKIGALYAAEALYAESKDFRKIIKIINKFKSNKEVPAVINRLQGIMYCYGQYYDKDVQKGVDLLKDAADNQGDKMAQYYLGHIYSHVMSDWSFYTESTDTLFNLIRAIDYYRMAADAEPRASLELGSLFADLNMNDSAKYYYAKAIINSDETLKKEANYRMGVLLYDLGEKDNKYLGYALDRDYAPAMLFAAMNEKEHQGAIEWYEAIGRYNGHRYIPPVIFEYILKNEKNKALDSLVFSRQEGFFNLEFVDAMYAMLVSKDSIKGAELMQESAAKGCKYAKMICNFRQMEKEIKESNYTISQISDLEELCPFITFANILVSYLYSEKAYYLDSISGKEVSEPFYKKASEYALKAINNGHPAGALLFIKTHIMDYYLKLLCQNTTSILSLKHELSVMSLMTRLLPTQEKNYFIRHAFHNDIYIYGDTVYKTDKYGMQYGKIVPNNKQKNFWIDVAIANKYLVFIIDLIIDTNNSEEGYLKKLFSSAMELVTSDSNEIIKVILSSKASSMIKDGYEDYIESLKNRYANTFKVDILEGKYKKLQNGEEVRLPYSWSTKRYFFDNRNILNEFGEIDNHIYGTPL